jgi:hypothetical protein
LITKSGAGNVGNVYGFSQAKGTAFFQIVNQLALASSGIDFKKFLFLYVQSGALTDRWNLTFQDGFNHQAELPELITDGTWTQTQKDQVSIMIDNTAFRYSTVNLMPSANRDCYFGRFVLDTPTQDLINTM